MCVPFDSSEAGWGLRHQRRVTLEVKKELLRIAVLPRQGAVQQSQALPADGATCLVEGHPHRAPGYAWPCNREGTGLPALPQSGQRRSFAHRNGEIAPIQRLAGPRAGQQHTSLHGERKAGSPMDRGDGLCSVTGIGARRRAFRVLEPVAPGGSAPPGATG